MQLGRTARDVDGMSAGLTNRSDHLIDNLIRHDAVPAVGTGIDVAVPTGHVAKLAKINLKDFQASRAQSSTQQGVELDAASLPLQLHGIQCPELLGGAHQWRTASAQAGAGTRRLAVIGEIFDNRSDSHD
jgi:hypothetical protein